MKNLKITHSEKMQIAEWKIWEKCQKVLDNADSHDILALNKSIHQSSENTFVGMNHETFHCIYPFGSPDV